MDTEDAPRLATFILVLPEALPIPHGTTWTTDVDEPEPALSEVAVVPVRDAPETWTNSGWNFVSLKFWQAVDDAAGPWEYAHRTALASRVLCELTGRDDPLDPTTISEPDEQPPVRTIVEAVTFVAREADFYATDDKPDPLTRCIDVLLDFHRAYRVRTHALVPALTYERIHPVVFWTSRTLSPASFRGRPHIREGIMNLDNHNIPLPTRTPLTEEEFLDVTELYFRTSRGDPLIGYMQRRLDTERDLWLNGEMGRSVVDAATAAEVLLGTILGLALWEESLATPSVDAAAVFSSDLRPRLRKEYSARFGGNWAMNSGPLGRWAREISDVRNRVVHAGYQPTKEEAALALDALLELERFVGDRLVDRWKKYPRTAWIFAGTRGFERRGRLRSAETWFADNGGRDALGEWLTDYAAWRTQVDVEIQRRAATN
ncbi:hypothetical protein [Salana multivorans]